MPNPNRVKALKIFESRNERDIYAEGLQQGLNHAPYGCSHPEPVEVCTERDELTQRYSAYILLGYYDSNGVVRWD